MTAPVRMRLSRARGFNLQAASRAINGLAAIKVDRSTWAGNPWRVECEHDYWIVRTHGGVFESKDAAAAYAVARFREHVEAHPEPLAELRGKNLACWCLGPHCHVDVLLELSNAKLAFEGQADE